MKLFRVPSVLNYSVPNSSIVAPDGSIIYISYGYISILRPKCDGQAIILDTRQKLLSIDCDPNWNDDCEYLACATEDRHIWIWNVKLRAVVMGHTAHCDPKEKDSPLPLCFTPDKLVVSADKKHLVVYDVLQNTYKTNTEIVRKHTITVLKVSPYNKDLIAAGTQAGLVTIISLQKMESFFTLRGHDQSIWSLDWIKVPAEVRITLDADDDLFDIYTYDDVENEFGGLKDKPAPDSDDERTAENKFDSFQEPGSSGHDNEFDFVEACETLKKEILGESTNCESTGGVDTNPNREECISSAIKDDTDSMSGSNETLSSRSSIGSGNSQTGVTGGERKPKVKSPVEAQDRYLLVTGSSEPHITVWDTKSGRSIDKINLPGGRGGPKSSFASKNIVVRWLNHTTLVTNDLNGSVIVWDMEQRDNTFIFHKASLHFPQRAIADIAVNRNTGDFWVFSAHQQISCLNTKLEQPRYDYSTLPPRNQAITLNNLDPNVVAVGSARRVSLINLSKLSPTNACFGSMTQKVQSQVLSLAFHPTKENLLAFTTREGRVGVFDTNRCANAPILMKPFFGKDVYSATWVRQKGDGDNDFDLFCCGQGKLVYFPQNGPKKHTGIEIPEFKSVTNVGGTDEYLSIGTHDGNVSVCVLAKSLVKIFNEKVSSRFISSFSWKGKQLAIASFENSIFVYDFSNLNDISKSVLTGHDGPGTFVNWHPFKNNLLVSASYDSTVKIWNTESLTCIYSITFERDMFIAIFHPSLDDTIIAGGIESMLTIVNYQKTNLNFKPTVIGKQNKPPSVDLKMAKPSDGSAVVKKARRERRKNNRNVTNDIVGTSSQDTLNLSEIVDEVEKKLESVEISDDTAIANVSEQPPTGEQPTGAKPKKEKPSKDSKLEYNYTTIFCLSMRELNRDPIATLNKMVNDLQENKKETRHARLLSQDDLAINSVLQEELQNHKTSNTNSIGHVIFPSLLCDLKTMILDKAETKSLTEADLALAPNVCEDFWLDVCRLFALQCVEKGEILRSIPYFLCARSEEEEGWHDAVEVLCDNHYYLEAVAVARMRICSLDPVNDKLIDNWTKHLISCGNFEAAAIVWTAMDNFEDASNILKRRQTPKPELQEIISKLQELHNKLGSKKKTEIKLEVPDIELPTAIKLTPDSKLIPEIDPIVKKSKVFPDLPYDEFEDFDIELGDSDESFEFDSENENEYTQ